MLLKAAVAAVPVAYATRAWWRRRRQRRSVLRGVPTVTVASAPHGLVRIEGVIGCKTPLLEGPLSGKACVAFEVQWKFSAAKYGDKSFVCVTGGIPFHVDDVGGGRAFVEIDPPIWSPDRRGPAGLAVTTRPQVQIRDKLESPRDPRVAKWQVHHDVVTFRMGPVEVREAIACPGDRVSVIGTAGSEPHPDIGGGDYRSPPTACVIRAAGSELIIAEPGRAQAGAQSPKGA